MTDFTIAQLDAMIDASKATSIPHDHRAYTLARQLRASLAREAKLREAVKAFVAYDESCDSPDQTGVEMMLAYDDAITAARTALGDAS